MSFAFDLISDLHVDTWDHFDWTGQGTSPFCIIAGDVGRDRLKVYNTLQHLSKCYQAVFYIDGNEEHRDYRSNLDVSYSMLEQQLNQIPNLVYLQENVVVINGIAIVGACGWWNFDFDLSIDIDQAQQWYMQNQLLGNHEIDSICKAASIDAAYMISSIKNLQTHKDVKKIIAVTHTLPDPALIAHDVELSGSHKTNVMGNRFMMQALAADTENKLHTWCFGHYHGSLDQTKSNIRFVNNCRGRGDTKYSKQVYYPLRIVVS